MPTFATMFRMPKTLRWVLLISLLLLLVMGLCRWASYLVFRLPETVQGPPSTIPDSMVKTFWLGFRFDARLVAIVALLVTGLTGIKKLDPFRNRTALKGWTWFFAFLSLILVAFYAVDFLHFRYLHQRLNASALMYLEDASISFGMVWQTYPIFRIVLGVIIISFLLVWTIRWLFKKVDGSAPAKNGLLRLGYYSGFFLLLIIAIFGRLGQYPLRWSDAFNLGSDFKANIALNPIQAFASSFKFRSSSFDIAKLKSSYPRMAAYLGVQTPDTTKLSFARQLQPDTIVNWKGGSTPNIVLVICESFSGYKSSMWGSPLNTTPFFASMCRDGLFFDNCFTPLIGTAKGVWATVTGIPDVELVKTASRNPMMVDQQTIINDFEKHEKYYFLGGSTSWANIRGILTNNIKGLKLYEEGSYSVPAIDVWGISDKDLFLEADKVLRKEPKPFFAIIQTADNHRPYTIPEADRKDMGLVDFPLDSLQQYGFESNDELNAFRYTDYCFKKFMEAAKTAPYYSNTLFVFVGDHGIAGNAGRLFPVSWTVQGLSANHVPLLFYAPGKVPAMRMHDLASQVDVLPTIAGIANIPYHNNTLGRDLLVNHAIDSGKNNRAFILDYNNKRMGILHQEFYYTAPMQGGKAVLSWADPLYPESRPAPSEADYAWWSQAYYETARYLLLHNKKTQ